MVCANISNMLGSNGEAQKIGGCMAVCECQCRQGILEGTENVQGSIRLVHPIIILLVPLDMASDLL